MRANVAVLLAVLSLCLGAGCSGADISDGPAGSGVEVPERPAYGEWLKIEPPGAVCGNGSQYKFFVNYSDVSNDLLVVFEPGGACWDFDSCTGRNGIRGAANPDGIFDDHMESTTAAFAVPLFKRQYETNITRDWNYVYIPYCTGDVHTGNAVTTYEDLTGVEEPIEFHHSGHANVQAVIEWMAGEFLHVPKMLVSGCSAGGAGSTVNYYDIRQGMPDVGQSYLLADSGPIFPAGGNSDFLHDKVYAEWNVGPLVEELPAPFEVDDFGSINTMLAEQFPEDRMAVTFFQRDYNYSLYSYERFYEPTPTKDEIMEMWAEDTADLREIYDQHDNLAYFLPYWRALNDSHCTTVITYAGSEIQEAGMGLDDYIADLLDDEVPLASYAESVQPDEDVD